MKGLGVPVENRWGLRPATVPGTNRLVPLNTARDLDTRGWLAGERAGDILLADSTIFTTLFGGDESLETFWKNIATR